MDFHGLLQRANLNAIQAFLIYGGDFHEEPSGKTYAERLKDADKNALEFFESRYTDIKEYDEITGCYYEQIAAYEEVYFEIGMILGAKIGMQLSERINELL